ncbi:hypothetical protein Sjap_011281 [Stephania japonica]|uniref:Uncharacterized protein n=1 Tax=Stephania japonica TaxID=461633 RepID=A0AAP0P5E4_9MAGN
MASQAMVLKSSHKSSPKSLLSKVPYPSNAIWGTHNSGVLCAQNRGDPTHLTLQFTQVQPHKPDPLISYHRPSLPLLLSPSARRPPAPNAPRVVDLAGDAQGHRGDALGSSHFLVSVVKISLSHNDLSREHNDFSRYLRSLGVLVTVHIGEMTVRETLAFSARVQGVGAGHVIKMLGKSMKILEVDKRSLMLSSSLTFVVAVNGSRKSNCALKWALERISDEGKVMFKLLHVRSRITTVPTPNEYFNSRMPIVVKGITQGGCISDSGATHLALLILPTAHAIRSSVSLFYGLVES